MKAFALIRMVGGQPDIDPEITPYYGYVLCDQRGGWGAYLISGTGAQLSAIDALPGVVGIVAVTESGGVKWGELDGSISGPVRTKVNNWLTNHDLPNIPAGWTYRRVIRETYRRLNAHFDLNNFNVAEP